MNTAGLLAIFVLLVFAVYALYGVVLAYHWIRFSASTTIAVFSLGTYIAVGLYLFGAMAAAIATL